MSDKEPIAWSQLTANQRNALIAQHVFGRKVVKWHPERDMLMRRVGVEGHENIPRYSESMDEAWKVLQKMAGDENTDWDFAGQFYSVCFVEMDIDDLLKWVATWTPAMICLAALRAQGFTIEIEESKQ